MKNLIVTVKSNLINGRMNGHWIYFAYIYLVIYTCDRVANAVKTVLNTLLSVEL